MTAPAGDFWATPKPLQVIERDPYEEVLPADGSASATGLRARLLSRADLATLPEPEPLIGQTVDLRTVAVVAGHYGSLKSFLLLDWACSVATGKDWQGRRVQPGSVLYVAAEGAYGLHHRIEAWEYAWQQQVDAQLDVLPAPVNLLDRRQVAEVADLAAGRSLVIVDTLARCMVGADENSARDMGMAVDALYRLRDATDGGTVAVAHHTGKDRATIRGSSALEAGVDTVYTTEGDASHMVLKRTKRKDGPLDDELNLHLQLELESGLIVSRRGVDMRPTASALMSSFVSMFGEVGATKTELRTASGMVPSSFHRALKELVAQGLLQNTGSDARPFYKQIDQGGRP